MARKRPINAELPPSGESSSPAPPAASKPTEGSTEPLVAPKRKRQPIPGALKAIAGLVLVAFVFLIAAVLGGGSSDEQSSKPAPVPTPTTANQAEPEAKTPTAEAAEELGYPSFATNNTTRVGGSDAATTAAGVSLAVFPATTRAQRPAAVALVDEDDWEGGVAAAVLMAAPSRAPLLVASADGLPEPTSQALEALDPQGGTGTKGTQAFAIGNAAAPEDLKTTQVNAGEPAEVAAELAALRERLAGRPPQHILLASDEDSAFAMPAAAWAARSGDPVLFSDVKRLPPATAKVLKRHPNVPVYVLGPSSAISSNVVREASKIAKRVRRVSGESPVQNAIALARYDSDDFGWNINDPGHGFVIARSDSPLDAGIAAPLSASGTWGPLLLTEDADTLPVELREYLLDIKPGYTTDPTRAFYNHVWVIGDQERISVNQQAEIDQLAELTKIGSGS